jgi:HSP20 family protein
VAERKAPHLREFNRKRRTDMASFLSGYDRDLFGEFERMRRQMDQVFGGWDSPLGIRSAAAGSFPDVNVGINPERVDVYVFAPGVDAKNLDVSLQQNLLTITGERKAEMPQDIQLYRNERFAGDFRRVVTLPDDIDPDKVDASYKDGVLHITVQRREYARARKIEVS